MHTLHVLRSHMLSTGINVTFNVLNFDKRSRMLLKKKEGLELHV
jgi:hypothetical protein